MFALRRRMQVTRDCGAPKDALGTPRNARGRPAEHYRGPLSWLGGPRDGPRLRHRGPIEHFLGAPFHRDAPFMGPSRRFRAQHCLYRFRRAAGHRSRPSLRVSVAKASATRPDHHRSQRRLAMTRLLTHRRRDAAILSAPPLAQTRWPARNDALRGGAPHLTRQRSRLVRSGIWAHETRIGCKRVLDAPIRARGNSATESGCRAHLNAVR